MEKDLENFSFIVDNKLDVNSNAKFALSTVDNPYSPFTNWNEWLQYDLQRARVTHGLDCSSMLGRFVHTSFEMSDEMYNNEVERAIKEILKSDAIGEYIMCTNPNYVEED